MADQDANLVNLVDSCLHAIEADLAAGIDPARVYRRWAAPLQALGTTMEREAHTGAARGAGDNRRPLALASLGSWPGGDPAAGPAYLTRRETEVLYLTTAGYSAKKIAKRLHLSVRTVYSHRRNVRRKQREHDAHSTPGHIHASEATISSLMTT